MVPELYVKIGDFTNIGGVVVSPVYKNKSDVFFYIDTKGQCIEFDGKACPEF